MRKFYFYLMHFGYIKFCEYDQPKRLKTRSTRKRADRILEGGRLRMIDVMALEIKNEVLKNYYNV